MNLYELTLEKAHELLTAKTISSVELTRAVIDRIRQMDDKIGAYLTITEEQALAEAAAADKRIAGGNAGPLTGIPLAVKDVMCTSGIRTTCASKMLENFIPPYDATVIEKLKKAGAVIVGKTNMDEFAMGSSTEHSAFQSTCNPWDRAHIPGGSSGGSAAAVAADMCLGSLGSDTGGSIRQPASHCGVTGIKPTYGRVSRYGLVAFASSLDQIGPIGKSVKDCAILLNAISGYDPKDSTSVPRDVPDFAAGLSKEKTGPGADALKGVTLGIPKKYFETKGLDPDVKASVENAIDTLAGLGAKLVDIDLPHTDYGVAAYYVIAPSEASSNLARYDGVKYGFRDQSRDQSQDQADLFSMYKQTRSKGFGPEVKRRIIIGTYCLSAGYYDAYYGKASQIRTLIMEDYQKAFHKCDAILTPVAPTPAYKIGENTDDPLTVYLSDIYTLSVNLAGLPAISVPCGFSQNRLPVGLQIIGSYFKEETLFKVAWHFEQQTDFHTKKPDIL